MGWGMLWESLGAKLLEGDLGIAMGRGRETRVAENGPEEFAAVSVEFFHRGA